MIAVIDGDSIPYIIAWGVKDLETDISNIVLVDGLVDSFIMRVLSDIGTNKYVGYIQGKEETFRHSIAKSRPYKGKRPTKPDWYVKWEYIIKTRLLIKWNFVEVETIESDDAVSITANEFRRNKEKCVVVTKDKDLRQIGGTYYNLNNSTIEEIPLWKAEYNLAYQLLIGDSTDNIPGLPRCGKKGAEKFLDELNGVVVSLIDEVEKLYYEKGHSTEYFLEQLSLVKLLVDPIKGFTIPTVNEVPNLFI